MKPERLAEIKEYLEENFFVDNPNADDVNEAIQDLIEEVERLKSEAHGTPHICNFIQEGIKNVEEENARLGRELAAALRSIRGEVGGPNDPGTLGVFECSLVDDLEEENERLRAEKNNAYSERNKVVAALANLCRLIGWPVGVAKHDPNDKSWEDDWRTIVFIDLPTGQASWHFHDSEKHLLAGLPQYTKPWDGHSTEQKYERLLDIQKEDL